MVNPTSQSPKMPMVHPNLAWRKRDVDTPEITGIFASIGWGEKGPNSSRRKALSPSPSSNRTSRPLASHTLNSRFRFARVLSSLRRHVRNFRWLYV